MKPKIKQKWLEALKSEEYNQSSSRLKTDKGFCCLGVLCDIHRKTIKKKDYKWESPKDGIFSYLESEASLPKIVIEWAGLSNEWGNLKKEVKYKNVNHNSLYRLNDEGMTFKQIAKVIEKQF